MQVCYPSCERPQGVRLFKSVPSDDSYFKEDNGERWCMGEARGHKCQVLVTYLCMTFHFCARGLEHRLTLMTGPKALAPTCYRRGQLFIRV